jgi:hypothetical protein
MRVLTAAETAVMVVYLITAVEGSLVSKENSVEVVVCIDSISITKFTLCCLLG